MIDGKFDVVFRGQIIKSMELAEVKANLANLFKSSPEAIEKLFSGEEAVIKKSLDYTTAMKYQSAIKKSGALALIKEIEEPVAKIVSNPNLGKATFGAIIDDADSNEEQVSARTTENINENASTIAPTPVKAPVVEAIPVSDGDMSLADAGSQIMPDKIYEKRDVDTSEFSLAAVGERLMPTKAAEVHKQPSIDHLSLEN